MAKNVHNFYMEIVFLNMAHKMTNYLFCTSCKEIKLGDTWLIWKDICNAVADKKLISLNHEEV